MARSRLNSKIQGTKRHRAKGVKKKDRKGNKPLSYALNKKNKEGPKVKNFDGEFIGHETGRGISLSLAATALVKMLSRPTPQIRLDPKDWAAG